MTDRHRLHQSCRENRQLIRENSALRAELHRARQEAAELEAANANLRVERDAADVLLGEAMDEALGAG
jgi:hypothetical protein